MNNVIVPIATQSKMKIVDEYYDKNQSNLNCFLGGCSESDALLAEEDGSGHRRGVFVVDGPGHYFECFVLVRLDCEGSCSRALQTLEGMKHLTPDSLQKFMQMSCHF